MVSPTLLSSFYKKGGRKMKKLLNVRIPVIVMILTLAPTLTQAFNSAAHIYIVERVFPDCGRKVDLRYGSIGPDVALFAEVIRPIVFMAYFDYLSQRCSSITFPSGSVTYTNVIIPARECLWRRFHRRSHLLPLSPHLGRLRRLQPRRRYAHSQAD